MPTLMPADTKAALGENADDCDSRSLLLDRFVFRNDKMVEAHRLHFSQVCADSFAAIRAIRGGWEKTTQNDSVGYEAQQEAQAFLDDTQSLALRTSALGPVAVKHHGRDVFLKAHSHQAFVGSLAKGKLIFAQLQSRLMVNMAGGVMENAGLCIDRFGLPYIPGSAAKACARRMALAALREWCEAGGRPEHKPSGDDNPCTRAVALFATPTEMLACIARVFGWVGLDWEGDSDFAWAEDGQSIRKNAAEDLAAVFGWNISEQHRAQPWNALPGFAGSVAFLSAYPVDSGKTGRVDDFPAELPALGKLELDVVTCHHGVYYSSEPVEPHGIPHTDASWRRWKNKHDDWLAHRTAPDTEEPVPVVFPAVAPGHVFAFALTPPRGADSTLIKHARDWLEIGLSTFGLGAKTNAGYGWFQVLPAFAAWFAKQRRFMEWMERARNFANATLREKEETALDLACESDVVARLEAEAPKVSKALVKFYREREPLFALLPPERWLNQVRRFSEFTTEQKEELALELSICAELRQGLTDLLPETSRLVLEFIRETPWLNNP
jgi:CRISPR-associated protein Cmr6